jgi:hypothetical protein
MSGMKKLYVIYTNGASELELEVLRGFMNKHKAEEFLRKKQLYDHRRIYFMSETRLSTEV